MIDGGLPPLALVLVLSSALIHALWDVLLAREPRGNEGARRSRGNDGAEAASAVGDHIVTQLAVMRWRVADEAWPSIVLSGAVEASCLGVRNGEDARQPAHTAYPVARGLAPVLLLADAVPG